MVLKGIDLMKKVVSIALLSGFIAAGAMAQNTTTPANKSAKPLPSNPAPVKKSSKAPAADQVWVNGKVYHCPGTRYYGNTKNGEYMTEQAAIAAGATASHNRPCVK